MHLAEIWRYPVKSMAGERVHEVSVGPLGLAWDRVGEVRIPLADRRGHCVMTTVDPDTLAQDRRVLQSILDRLGGRLDPGGATIQR